ncbi:hypothetical protein L1D14_07580 [Vibrio tubiashii]|uniref:hypothetical protein n=1 Tax=Vibrio tubiashii TaxID=29498 RepID=UPI001EFE931F|nr:hypothetical protein [Vibrio tubiashii]MCG9576099.1 hypothetical protein [Vibrio tubiashii]
MSELDRTLPDVKVDLHPMEEFSRPSERVLIRLVGTERIMAGVYFHESNEWHAEGIDGKVIVEEWWALPKKGTGTVIKPR